MSRVALLTGGGDKPYAIGLATSLSARRVPIDFIASNELDVSEVRTLPGVRLLNLRGDMARTAPLMRKVTRVLVYYIRLIIYALTANASVFHVLWNNKFEFFDRTLLLLLYRLLGKRIVLTIHNVNIAQRDGRDGPFNRLTLKIQYTLAHHLFVHTDDMRRQLEVDFGVPVRKVTTVPFGVNQTVPTTAMTRDGARLALGLSLSAKILLFFGNIAPYKGVEYAVQAMSRLVRTYPDAQLVIAGSPKADDSYWPTVVQMIKDLGLERNVVQAIAFIPDGEVETFFKAADVLVLPYTHVFQSGVLFLGYHFGLPAIATNVGGLKDDVIDGVTGFTCDASDVEQLAATFEKFFRSPLYADLESRRSEIRGLMAKRNSWSHVSEETCRVYRSLWTNGAASWSGFRAKHPWPEPFTASPQTDNDAKNASGAQGEGDSRDLLAGDEAVK